jgi:hypothetical protein
MFEACHAAGIAPCVEMKTFRADFDEHPELIPTGVDGRPIRYGRLVQGICLSRTDYVEKIEADLRTGLATYDPAGVWLDYLTYAGWFETPEPDLQESCFCDACIREFCEAEGIDAETPAEIVEHHAALWRDHKCLRIAGYAARYASVIRELRPGCLVGAYMCPYRPEELDGALSRIFAQDYDLLAPSIDVFTPLIYVEKSGRNAGWGREFLEASVEFVPDNRKVQLILDFLDFPDSLRATAGSTVPSWGLQMFGGREVLESAENRAIFHEAVERIREAR